MTAAEEHKLAHREAVGFSNIAGDRYRLVAVFYGMPVLILPPTEHEKRLSIYLQVSRFIRKFCSNQNLIERVDDQIVSTQTRIEKQKARRKAAKKANRKRNGRRN
jgi:hypothetical protein